MRIPPTEFLNTPEELHAFIQGFCEIACPFPPLRRVMSQARSQEIADEYHYYLLGRVLGVPFWLLIALFIKATFQ